MKKTDYAMIILIASISALVAFFVARSFLGDAVSDPVTVKTIERIESGIADPDPTIFNNEAINPTVEVQITPNGQ